MQGAVAAEDDINNVPSVLDDVAAEDGYDPTEAAAIEKGQKQQFQDQFNHHMSQQMRDRGDLFDEMVVHEEGIRLGQEGWKERYYEVHLLSSSQLCMPSTGCQTLAWGLALCLLSKTAYFACKCVICNF